LAGITAARGVKTGRARVSGGLVLCGRGDADVFRHEVAYRDSPRVMVRVAVRRIVKCDLKDDGMLTASSCRDQMLNDPPGPHRMVGTLIMMFCSRAQFAISLCHVLRISTNPIPTTSCDSRLTAPVASISDCNPGYELTYGTAFFPASSPRMDPLLVIRLRS
jgi:hypothetical protein